MIISYVAGFLYIKYKLESGSGSSLDDGPDLEPVGLGPNPQPFPSGCPYVSVKVKWLCDI